MLLRLLGASSAGSMIHITWIRLRMMMDWMGLSKGFAPLTKGIVQPWMILEYSSQCMHLDTLLDTLMTARLNGAPDVDHVDSVTWRGIMTKIFCTPFTRNEPWKLRATRCKNTLFMEEQATDQKLR
ncbi:hypothetical protein O0I10_011860 [Lichtheimia ornata]|uniref:Decapping nuclease n=1 Tax=Lichtheimia ornata TaxID=688661 RepID=A0AAD7XS78_9FUNG|nr:uncharacterized protein O0I10_011860 [Lichtheimia ornata]KAJ8652535.1 hypothetical protein O0I10_011860 [Lichtheimia ornata]